MAPRPTQVNLKQPLRVFIVYGTAIDERAGERCISPRTFTDTMRSWRSCCGPAARDRRLGAPVTYAAGIEMCEV